MSQTLHVFDPTPPVAATASTAAPRAPVRLEGAVVGFIDNAKPNFDRLVDALAEALVTRAGVREVIKRRKRAASVPAPDEMVAELTARCDLVIAGSGD